jgi:hypothetical protein
LGIQRSPCTSEFFGEWRLSPPVGLCSEARTSAHIPGLPGFRLAYSRAGQPAGPPLVPGGGPVRVRLVPARAPAVGSPSTRRSLLAGTASLTEWGRVNGVVVGCCWLVGARGEPIRVRGVVAHQGEEVGCSVSLSGISSPSRVGRHGAIRRSTQMGSSTSSASTVGVAMPITSSHLVGAETCPHAAGCRQRIS